MPWKWLTTAGLLLALATFAWGQRGGGFHGGGGFAPRGGMHAGGGFAPRGGMRAGGMAFAPPVRSFHAGGFHGAHHGPTIVIGFHHGHVHGHGFYRYGYAAYPYYGWYSPFLWDWERPSYDTNEDSNRYAESQYQTAAEINRLADEVEELRGERGSAPVEQAPRPAVQQDAKSDQDLPVILVFLDKHIQEIRNYAVANEMVVAFDGTRTRKYPLMDIDLAATMKLNDERGVNFDVPNPIMN